MRENSARLGRYLVDREIGRGAMGVVYDAFDPVLNRRVALKTLAFEDADAARSLECLKREASAIAALDHPNIVAVYDAFECGSKYCLVLQYIDGETLSARLAERSRFPLREGVAIVVPVLEALGYAHGRGLVHRDVKPSNIMLSRDGMVKLVDFGIAKPVGIGRTSSGLIMGTPGYMSPEQLMGEPVDGRSDIFSVACALYELLTGAKAFSGTDSGEVMYRVVRGSPPPLDALNDDRLRQVLRKALARSPGQRFDTCADLARELLACCSADRPAEAPDREPVRLTAPSVRVPALMAALFASLAIQGGSRIRIQPLAAELKPPLVGDVAAKAKIPAESPPLPAPPPLAARKMTTTPSHQGLAVGKPADPFEALITAGDEAFQQGRYADALGLYSEAARTEPGRRLAKSRVALALTVLGRGEETLGTLEENVANQRKKEDEDR